MRPGSITPVQSDADGHVMSDGGNGLRGTWFPEASLEELERRGTGWWFVKGRCMAASRPCGGIPRTAFGSVPVNPGRTVRLQVIEGILSAPAGQGCAWTSGGCFVISGHAWSSRVLVGSPSP